MEQTDGSVVWTQDRLTANLLKVMARRVVDADQSGGNRPFSGTIPVSSQDIAAFIDVSTEDPHITDLLWGLTAIQYSMRDTAFRFKSINSPISVKPLPPAYTILKLMFLTKSEFCRLFDLQNEIHFPLPKHLVSVLRTGNIRKATELAIRRLRIVGVNCGLQPLNAFGIDPMRLAAALLFPVNSAELMQGVRLLKIKKQ